MIDVQPRNQVDADEIVRIIITCNPGMRPGAVFRIAHDEGGLSLTQAAETAAKYLGWDGRTSPTRCVEHNAVLPCGRCS